MANIHAPRLGGDDYQHLYSWWLILGLKLPDEHIQKVIVENKEAVSVDDVTIHYEPGQRKADRFYQIKYHVDTTKTYSAQEFQKELLKKFWDTWQILRQHNTTRMVELYLVSTWAWDRKESPKIWIDAATGSIDVDEFLSTSIDPIAGIRQSWQDHLGASDEDFKNFLSSLHLQLQYGEHILQYELIVERMKWLKLRTDIGALYNANNIVRQWIKDSKHEITLERLEAALKRFNLYLPDEQEPYISIHMETIQNAKRDPDPDYHLNWVEMFVINDKGQGDHQLKDPAGWNMVLRRELYALQAQIRKQTTCHLIKASGWSRLSPWLAFGYVFSKVAGYDIELDIHDQHWRTNADASPDFSLSVVGERDRLIGETISGMGDTVAVGISSVDTNISPELDIRRYLQQQDKPVAHLLLLQANPAKLRHANDAVALANTVKKYASDFVKHYGARRLLLFYAGPVGGACFIGHKLNKVCDEVQVMEYQPGQTQKYAPTFLLS